MPIALSSWSCPVVWDDSDFTPCFRQNYLENYPIALIILSAVYILIHFSETFFNRRKPFSPLTAQTLTSPRVDPHLGTLESNVIFSSLASNVLPALTKESSEGKAEPTPEESLKIIEDFKRNEEAASKRWDVLSWWVTLAGSAAWLVVEIASAVTRGQWKGVAFPAFLTLLSLLPRAPIAAILSLHLAPTLVLFRSVYIGTDISILQIISMVVELVLWSAVISIPYSEDLDRLLEGGKSKGGGSVGSDGKKLRRHLEEPTSIFARATYSFMVPFLVKHYQTPATLEDIPALREDDGAAASLGSFRAFTAKRDVQYAKRHKGALRKRNLAIDLILFFLPDLRVQCIWSAVATCLQYLPPTGLRLLLKYITERKTQHRPTHVAVLYIAMMAIGQAFSVVAYGQTLMIGRRLCVRLRTIIIAEVFLKALRRRDLTGNVKKTAKVGKSGKAIEDPAGATDGKIANLVSVDAFLISEICAYAFYLFGCPLGIVVNCTLLYNTLGLASFAGIGALLLLVPVQAVVARLFTIIQRRLMAATDIRLEAVTEVIAHIKLIKFNAWESKFFDRMADTRKRELHILAQRFATNVLSNIVIWGTPVIVTATAFAVHSLVLHQLLTPDRAFSSLILFNMLRDPLALIQDTITRLLQSYTSCQRIQAYLDEPDTLKYKQITAPGPNDPQIGFKGAKFGYSSPEDRKEAEENDESEAFQLGELNLSFPVGKLSMIVGPVGCGKTTLILSLLGETYLIEGQVFMPDDKASRDLCPVDPETGLSDTVAFCSQTPWLVGASIKENIIFGSTWDAKRYDAVVDACALRKDFEIFELGDETEVGEKGTTCSGGQKARIALARAVYSSARTVILDDVLSAVDAQTARHLYNHVLQGSLTEGRTVILVTHAVGLVASAASFVVMLDGGVVTASGTPQELIASGQLEVYEDEKEGGTSTGSSTVDENQPEKLPKDNIEDNLDGEDTDILKAQKQHNKDIAAPEIDKLSKQLVKTESQGQGMISLSTYLLYFKSMGGLSYWIIIATCFFGAQILQVMNNAWIRDWANSNQQTSVSATLTRSGRLTNLEMVWQIRSDIQEYVLAEKSTLFYLGVYCAISAAYLVGVASRVGVNFYGSLTASNKLYNQLLRRILGAKMRFFDSTPSGRIMNRLSKDISSIDQEAAEILMYFANCVLSCLAVLVVVVLSTPAFLIALVVITILYCTVGALYVTTSREIKRIDSVTRSPLMVSFSEVLVGMSTIRSYGDSARFARKIFNELDQNTRCFWYLWQANRVLNNLSNFVGSLVTIFASIFALRSKTMNAGAVGFSITYALSFTEFVLWVVRLYAASEMTMNSVERVAEYLDLEVEEEAENKGIEPPAYWPSRTGSVIVENLTCRYAPQLDPVLRGVSFIIGPKEKIGICGRTGSGKSTLALSFFRFLHQESGSITIDGLDISKLSLTSLRSRLTILPQEAQLFSGTIRDNLDPFSQHEDYEIWEALRQCGLAGKTPGPSRAPSRAISRAASAKDLTISATTLKDDDGDEEGGVEERVIIRSLEEKVAVGGKNFSQGQRQLLALARGLLKLRHSSFLIMDESTANLDHATDQTIQNVLRTGLVDTQMLVIAHRLMTVCGLDKILVLDKGKVVEFGTPFELLQDPYGRFRELCRQSGEEVQLFELAKNVHEAKLRGEEMI